MTPCFKPSRNCACQARSRVWTSGSKRPKKATTSITPSSLSWCCKTSWPFEATASSSGVARSPPSRAQEPGSVRLVFQSFDPQEADPRSGQLPLHSRVSRCALLGPARSRQIVPVSGHWLPGHQSRLAGPVPLDLRCRPGLLHDEVLGEEDKLLSKYLKPDLLIIDDMGMKQLPRRSGECHSRSS